MMANLRYWYRGLVVAAMSMIVCAAAIGCYIALMLLVISMEEGGDNLSAFAASLTGAVVLLSQGVGFEVGSIRLTIIPLLLTILLVWLIASLAKRVGTSPRGFVSALLVWELFNILFVHNAQVVLTDLLPLVILKTGIVFSLGYALAAVPRSSLTETFLEYVSDRISPQVRKAVRIGSLLGLLLVAVYLMIGLVTVVYWCWSNSSAVVNLYELSGMQTGSRILTTIACLAWIPNLVIWSLSWMFGSGFAIGDLASFSLWSSQGTSLPALPVFGVLPQAVETSWIRIALMCIPLAASFVSGLVVMLFNKGFHIRIKDFEKHIDVKHVALGFVYPAGAFCISSALVDVLSSLIFNLSNGSLGTKHLAHIGVDVIVSTRKVGHPTALGLFSAWLLTLVSISAFFGIRWVIRRVREGKPAESAGNSDNNIRESAKTSRTVASTLNNKEEQGDNNEPTDTTSSGIGLP
jgi:hypothetical protein